MRVLATLLLVAAAPLVLAQSYVEPARGTDLRRNLMNALRPVAEIYLGPPVEFLVSDLRVSGNVAFASVTAQRPGGGDIDMDETPWARQGSYDPDRDRPALQALLLDRGDTWVVVEHLFSPADAWLSEPRLCAAWAPVLPEYCG